MSSSGSSAATTRARSPIVERAVGAEPVLTPQTTALFRAVADRWAGNFVDVVRLAVPSRHAAAESRAGRRPRRSAGHPGRRRPPTLGAATGPARRTAPPLSGPGRAARAVWSALPGEDWAERFAEALRTPLAAGRGASLVGARTPGTCRGWTAAMTARRSGPGRHVVLVRRPGPGRAVRAVACGAPRRGQSGDRHPVRGVRAGGRPGLLVSGTTATTCTPNRGRPTRTPATCWCCARRLTGRRVVDRRLSPERAEGQQLVETGWAHEIVAERAAVRAAMPPDRRPPVTTSELARDPAARRPRACPAWRGAQPGRRWRPGGRCWCRCPGGGYVPSLACARDRTPARCSRCPVRWQQSRSDGVPACTWCGRPAGDWTCPACGRGACVRSPSAPERTAGGVGPGLSGHRGSHLGRRARARGRPRRPGARRRHAGRRTGGRRWLRRCAVARRRGRCSRAATCERRRRPAAMDERRRAGPAGRSGGRRAPRRVSRRCRRWCGGTRPVRRPESWPNAPRWDSRPRCG